MKLFCAALTAAPVTGDNSIVPIAIIAMAAKKPGPRTSSPSSPATIPLWWSLPPYCCLPPAKNKCRLPTACHVQAVFFYFWAAHFLP